MKILNIDIETYSSEEIKNGVYKYVDAHDFDILLFAYAVDGGEVRCIDLTVEDLPGDIAEALTDEAVTKIAFNAQFERVCLGKYLGTHLDPRQWRCTMVVAQQLGLPASLEKCAEYLSLAEQKDASGKNLIKYFSMPCKATKTNGGRTRNLSEHDPEKWQQFIDYCKQDVRTEMAIADKLAVLPIHDREWQHYVIDQTINDRGVALDVDLVRSALYCKDVKMDALQAELKALTGVANPNSRSQLLGWLQAHGYAQEGLTKADVKTALKTATGDVRRVLELKLQSSMSSLKKYETMERVLCSDGRVHGLLQFYGASRTGRWAGRLVQVQNLARNYLDDLDDAREYVKARDIEAIEMLYDSLNDTLKQLVRTAFIAEKGDFYVSDFSAIEARVIAWYAKENWKLDVFKTHGKIYEATAAQMFHIPLEQVDKEMRQRGKVAELACIAKGSLVLTHKGLVPIEKVTLEHKLWDGKDWVFHEGVLYKGEREVITYEGLTATKDHLVWGEVDGEYRALPFGKLADRRARLCVTGDGRKAIRLGRDNSRRKTMAEKVERPYGPCEVCRVRKSKVDPPIQSKKWEIERVPELLPKTSCTKVANKETNRRKTTVYKSKRQKLQKLRCAGDRISIRFSVRSLSVHDKNIRSSKTRIRVRQNRCERTLRSGELEVGNTPRKLPKSAAVYDILNAGPRNRFTVSGVLVHNCGYQGGVGALVQMGALDMGVKEEELQNLVDSWRRANPRIVQLWKDVHNAAIRALRERTTVKLGRLKFIARKGFLFIELPSGRRLTYAKAKLEAGDYGDQITYEGQGDKAYFTKQYTYGGKLVENIVQATARDLLAEALLRLEEAGLPVVFHVHDEAIVEAEGIDIETMNDLMAQAPDWADGLPLNSDGYVTKYYRKD